MNEPLRKLQHRESDQTAQAAQQAGASAQEQQRVREFQSVEEMIRHDAAKTEVPGTIAERLKASAQGEAPPKPWWQRLFGK